MSLCINPLCSKPQNRDDELFCLTCGSELLLQGRFRVMRQLGGGGFGLTFEVNEVRGNTPKVLKVLINNEPKAIELFQQEATVLSQLNHPGIPQVEQNAYFVYFPRNSQNSIHCIVMEKIVGMDLQKWMENRSLRPIDPTLAMQWLRELVTILDQVHKQNFFHRDIKPPNIMLRATGELALIDFGTVRAVTGTVVNQQGGVTGVVSAGYTPLEQINHNAVPQSDFFALGRTFVYLLTGKEPTDRAIYNSYIDEVNWRTHAPNISPHLADLIDQMMARFAAQRPANTQEILQRLVTIERNISQNSTPRPQSNSTPNSPTSSVVQYAGFWRRLGADLIDQVILISTSFMTAVVFVAAIMSGSSVDDDTAGFLWLFLYVIIAAIYSPVMECSSLQGTLGKMALGIIVTDLNGNKISFGVAFARHISKFISYLTLGVGYIMAGFTSKGQTLHDQITGCLVVKKR